MAVAATCPVLVSIVRSLEVVMALIIDIITRDNFVHVDDMRFWYKVIGACTVTLCVTSMSVADKIHQGLTACTRYNYFIQFLFWTSSCNKTYKSNLSFTQSNCWPREGTKCLHNH